MINKLTVLRNNDKVKTITLTISRNFSIICAATALTASMAATTTGDNKYLGLAGVAGNMSFLGLCIDTKNRNNDNKNIQQEVTMKNVHIDANGQIYFRRTEGWGTLPDTSKHNIYYPKYSASELALVQQHIDAKAIQESQRREAEAIEREANEAEAKQEYQYFEQMTLFG